MFYTRYHDPRPCGLDPASIEGLAADARKHLVVEEAPWFPSSALRALGIDNEERGLAQGRTSLALRIDGMVDGKIRGTHFDSGIIGLQPRRTDQVIMIGYVLLHYQLLQNAGTFGPEDGLQVLARPDKQANPDACQAQMEATRFALTFAMPEDDMREICASGDMQHLRDRFPFTESFIKARARQLGLSLEI